LPVKIPSNIELRTSGQVTERMKSIWLVCKQAVII